jgi:hypothetical protein
MITAQVMLPKETAAADGRRRGAAKHGADGGRAKKKSHAPSNEETLAAKSTQRFRERTLGANRDRAIIVYSCAIGRGF